MNKKLECLSSLALTVVGILSTAFAYAHSVKNNALSSWTGAYVGFNFGGTVEKLTLHAHQLGLISFEGACNTSSEIAGTYPGIQLGLTKQMDNNWVIGLAGNYNFMLNKNRRLACVCEPHAGFADVFNIHNDIQASVVGRIGYSLSHNILPYVSTGLAISHLGLNYTNEALSTPYSNHRTQTGWQTGAGVEWSLASNWSVSFEYYYTDYGTLNMALPIIYGLNDPNGNARLNMTANNVQATIKYWAF